MLDVDGTTVSMVRVVADCLKFMKKQYFFLIFLFCSSWIFPSRTKHTMRSFFDFPSKRLFCATIQYWEIENIFIHFPFFFIVFFRAASTISSPFFCYTRIAEHFFCPDHTYYVIWKARLWLTKWKQMNEFLLNEHRVNE